MKIKSLFPILLITICVILSTTILIWLDHETKTWDDFMRLGNILSGLLFYAFPAFIVVLLIFFGVKKHLNIWVSAIFSAIIGIPFSFVSMIFILLVLKA